MPDASSLMTMQQIRYLYNLQKANVTADYDSTATYEIGDYCLYLGILYRCISTISTAEDFDSSHWVSTNVDAELDRIETAAVAKTDIVNNLTSTSTNAPLSANMGKALNDAITQSTADVIRTSDVVNNLTSTSTTAPLSANMGKALNTAIVQSTAKSTSSVDVQIYTGNITAYINKLLKCNGLVYVFIEVETTSGQTLNTDDAFARIPSGWRPKVMEEFPASILQSNGIWATYKVSIDTNGGIKQLLTSSAKGVSFVAVYEHA